MPHAIVASHPASPSLHVSPALPHTRRPAWLAVAVGWLAGLSLFCAVIITISLLFGSDRIDAPAVWGAPSAAWHQWGLVALASFLPLLIAAGVSARLAHGAVRRRLRLSAYAVLTLAGVQALCSITVEQREFMTIAGWWSASSERLIYTSLAITLTAAALAWAATWLTLAIANWQPPAHLVRRPSVRR